MCMVLSYHMDKSLDILPFRHSVTCMYFRLVLPVTMVPVYVLPCPEVSMYQNLAWVRQKYTNECILIVWSVKGLVTLQFF